MFRKMLTIGSLIVIAFLLVACGDNRAEKETETVINYDITAPLYLEKDYHSIGPIGEGAVVPFKIESITNVDENIRFESLFSSEDVTVKFGKTEEGGDCFVISNAVKEVRIPCSTINLSARVAYVNYVDLDRDGKKEISVVYWYDDSKYGVFCVNPDTLEKMDVIAPSGTMFTAKQADAINRAIAGFKEEHPEYVYKWEDVQGATGKESSLSNDTTEHFNVRITNDGVLEIDVIHQGYPGGEYAYIVTAQIAYKNGEFVVDKVVLDAQRY